MEMNYIFITSSNLRSCWVIEEYYDHIKWSPGLDLKLIPSGFNSDAILLEPVSLCIYVCFIDLDCNWIYWPLTIRNYK
jgi:hypothetical protein